MQGFTLCSVVALIGIFFLVSTPIYAQRPVLKAYCREAQAPFSYRSSISNTTCQGYLIDLFENIARIMGVEAVYIPQNSSYTLSAVQTSYFNAEADVALGFTSLNDERSLLSDFSVPYLTTGYRFYMVKTMLKSNANFFEILVNPAVVLVISLLFLLIVVSTVIMWILELIFGTGRDVTFSKGLYEFLVSTIGLVMTGEHTYDSSSKMVKVIICVGWIVGVILSDLFTGLITANLAVAAILKGIKGPEDMIGRRVGVLEGSNLVPILQKYNIQTVTVPNMEIAYHDFTNGNPLGLDGLADLSPVLYYLFGQNGGNQGYFSAQFSDVTAGLAVPKDSPYLRNISNAILTLRQDGTLDRLYTAWIAQAKAVENAQDIDVDPNYSTAAFSIAIIILIFILAVFLISSSYYVIRKVVKFRRLVAMNHEELQGKTNFKLLTTLILEIIGIKKLEVQQSEELKEKLEKQMTQHPEIQYNKAQMQYLSMVKERSPTFVMVPPQLDEAGKPNTTAEQAVTEVELRTTSVVPQPKTIVLNNEVYEIAPEMSFILETFVKTYCKKVSPPPTSGGSNPNLLYPQQEENDLPFRTSVDSSSKQSPRKRSMDKRRFSKNENESMESLIRDSTTQHQQLQEESFVIPHGDSITLDLQHIQDQ